MKTGVIDVGGGLRGIYGAGVFDRCIEEGVSFDCCIGVSAGAANIVSYMAGQSKRNYRFYTEYVFRKKYMSVGNALRTGSMRTVLNCLLTIRRSVPEPKALNTWARGRRRASAGGHTSGRNSGNSRWRACRRAACPAANRGVCQSAAESGSG